MQGWEKPVDVFSVDVVAPGLVDAGSVFGFLAAHRGEVFPRRSVDDMFADRVRGGHPSVPGTVVLSALVLQALFGLTDREVVERLTFDLRWKAACGVGVDQSGFHHTVLVYWRNRIGLSANPDRISQAVQKIISDCGVVKGKQRRVVDSTVVDDAVARQDTIKLLIWQIARIGEVVPELKNMIMGLPGGVWYHDRLKPDIDWTSREAKDQVVSVLVNDSLTVIGWATATVDGYRVDDPHRVLVDDQTGLLAVLAGQDVEPAPGSDGTDGRWRIAQRTAPDRIISVVDRQSRHIRKTGQDKHDGFKAHIVGEPETGLIMAAMVSPGCGEQSSDARNAVQMLCDDRDVMGGTVTQVLGDSAYDTTEFLAMADRLGVEPIVKPRPVPKAVFNGYSLDDFKVDLDMNTITCPAGHQPKRSPRNRASFTRWCGSCPLKPRCTTAKKGRIVVIGETQLRLRQHRQQAENPSFIQRLRTYRPMAERSLAWMIHPGRRSPYRGIKKTNAWWNLRAAGINLKRLVSLGVDYQPTGWVLNQAT